MSSLFLCFLVNSDAHFIYFLFITLFSYVNYCSSFTYVSSVSVNEFLSFLFISMLTFLSLVTFIVYYTDNTQIICTYTTSIFNLQSMQYNFFFSFYIPVIHIYLFRHTYPIQLRRPLPAIKSPHGSLDICGYPSWISYPEGYPIISQTTAITVHNLSWTPCAG